MCFISIVDNTNTLGRSEMKKTTIASLLILSLSSVAQTALAAQITSFGQLTGITSTIDFSQTTNSIGVGGPVQIGALVGEDVTASSPNSSLYLYNGGWGLNANGSWDSGRNGYMGLWPNNGPVRVSFNDAPISGFAFFMNYIPNFEAPTVLSAYDAGGTLLESFDVTNLAAISTPNGVNAGEVRGIQRGAADIAYLEITGKGTVLDDLTFGRGGQQVPEPATLGLFGLAIAALGSVRRKKKTAA